MPHAIRRDPNATARPVATVESVAAREERHTSGHTRRNEPRVRLTVLEDIPGLNMRPAQPVEPELEGIVPRTVHAMPGDELIVSHPRAARLESSGKAIRVDTAKMGKGQKRLLVVLLDLSRERHVLEASGNALHSIAVYLRVAIGRVHGEDWRSPEAREYVGDAPEVEGDALRRMVSVRVSWDTGALIERSGVSVTKPALSQALRHLERRGLVFRDVAWGERGRTGAVELTAAGWRVAADLAPKH